MEITIFQLFILTGIIFIAAELFVGIQSGFDLVLIGTSLLLGGLAGLISGNLYIALTVASVLSIAYIFFGRKTIKNKVMFLTSNTNIDRLIGKTGLVIRSITPDTPGMIRVDDEDWRATSNEVLFEKEKAVITSIEGVTVHVIKFEKKANSNS